MFWITAYIVIPMIIAYIIEILKIIIFNYLDDNCFRNDGVNTSECKNLTFAI